MSECNVSEARGILEEVEEPRDGYFAIWGILKLECGKI